MKLYKFRFLFPPRRILTVSLQNVVPSAFVEKFLDIIRDLLGAEFFLRFYVINKINYISNVYFRLPKDKVC